MDVLNVKEDTKSTHEREARVYHKHAMSKKCDPPTTRVLYLETIEAHVSLSL